VWGQIGPGGLRGLQTRWGALSDSGVFDSHLLPPGYQVCSRDNGLSSIINIPEPELLKSHGLPDDPNELHRLIDQKLDELTIVISLLVKKKSERIMALKELLR
jgi:hypothetical protein